MDDQPLSAVFDEMERRFGITITVSTPSILEQRLTYLDQQGLGAEALLRDICQIKHLGYRTTARGFEVFVPQP